MFWRMTKAVIVLPGNVLLTVPLMLQFWATGWPFAPFKGTALGVILAAVLALPALALARWTMRLFMTEGNGTPAPWDPPQNFVVSGPYQYMRNPMLSAVIALICAEALALCSGALLAWACVFFALNTAYFIGFEEPALKRRFGAAYCDYVSNVPRWLPRRQPYNPPPG